MIGELVTYRLTLTIPEGVTPAAQVVDTLDTGLAFVDVVSVSSSPGVSMATPIGTGTAPANVSIGPPGVGNVVTFNPGAITNANSSAAAETIVVEYRAVVLNVAGNQAGTPLDNSAVLSFTGGSLAAASAAPVAVIEPTFTLTKTAAPASGDANDPITFTITVTSNNGATDTDAFDLSLTDVVPAGMTYVAGSLASPGGTGPVPVLSDAAAPTLTATWASFPRNANRTITFQATINGTVFPNQTITNSVNLTWTSLSGSPGTRSTYNPSSTERTGAGGVNDYTLTATRDVTVTNVAPQKSIVATSEAHTTGNNLAVGEIVRFRLVLRLPETTVQHLQLRDTLPAGLTFLDDGTARAKFVGDGNVSSAAFDGPGANDAPAVPCANLAGSFTLAQAASTASIPSATVDCTLADLNISRLETSEDDAYVSGGTVFFKLGTVTNADNEVPATDNNEFVIVELNALLDNSVAGSNDGGETRTNALQPRRWTGSAMASLGSSVNATALTVREPAIPFSGTANNKTVSPTTGDAGDTVTYTVTFTNQNPAANTTAFEVGLLDTLPAAVALNLGSVAVNLGGCASGLTNASAGNTVDVTLASVPAGCTVTTTYQAVVQSTVNPGQLVTNTARLAYTSLPGPLGTCPNGTTSCVTGAAGTASGERDGSGGINDYAGSDQATFTVLSPGFTKAVVATSEPTTGAAQGNPAVTDLTVGETVTFRMRTVLPEGTTPIVTVTDNLPFAPGVLGVVSAAVTWVGANLTPANSPALVTISDVQLGDGIDDRVVFDFGQVFNTPDGTANASDEIEVEVVAVVVNVPANGAGDLLTNSAVLAYGGGLQASATADVELVEPALNVAKSAAPATGDAGDVITYTMTVEQLPASTADAFDVVVTDTLPANTIWIGNVTPVSGTAPTVDAASFPVVTFSWAQIPESDGPYVFTYQVQLTNAVQPGDILSNSAVAAWSTLPGSDPNERSYTDTASSSVTVTQPGVTKAVVDVGADTTVAETGTAINGTEPDLTIGEQVAYTVTLTLIEGTTSNALVVDDLPVAPGILEVVSSEVVSFGANVSGTGLQPGQAGVASDRNADTRNDRVTFSLGTLTNFPDGVSDADDLVVLRVVAVVPNLPANQGGLDNLTNTAAFSFAGGGLQLGAADVDIVAPLLSVTKTNLVPYGDAGDTITYEVRVAHTGASTADAFEVTLVDALPAGQTTWVSRPLAATRCRSRTSQGCPARWSSATPRCRWPRARTPSATRSPWTSTSSPARPIRTRSPGAGPRCRRAYPATAGPMIASAAPATRPRSRQRAGAGQGRDGDQPRRHRLRLLRTRRLRPGGRGARDLRGHRHLPRGHDQRRRGHRPAPGRRCRSAGGGRRPHRDGGDQHHHHSTGHAGVLGCPARRRARRHRDLLARDRHQHPRRRRRRPRPRGLRDRGAGGQRRRQHQRRQPAEPRLADLRLRATARRRRQRRRGRAAARHHQDHGTGGGRRGDDDRDSDQHRHRAGLRPRHHRHPRRDDLEHGHDHAAGRAAGVRAVRGWGPGRRHGHHGLRPRVGAADLLARARRSGHLLVLGPTRRRQPAAVAGDQHGHQHRGHLAAGRRPRGARPA